MREVHDRQRIRSYGLEYFNDSVIQKRTNNPALAQHRDCLSSLFFAASYMYYVKTFINCVPNC